MEASTILPYGKQSIDEDDIAAVTAALRGDFLTTGPAVPTFEENFARACDVAHAVACSSGTAALHIAALAAGVAPGTTTIVPSITFLATANVAILSGAEVVFADVDPENGLMRPSDFEEALSRAEQSGARVQAVFPVHVGGQMADIEAISEMAARSDCRVIEDACHALGSRYQNHLAGDGTYSDMATFSFHPVKTIAMGEGGAVTTRDPELAEKLRQLRSHGMTREAGAFEHPEQAFDARGEANPWYYEMPEIGLNYRASDIHCALGNSQLTKLDKFIAQRRSLVARYDQQIDWENLPAKRIKLMPDMEPCWHLYTILIDSDRGGMDRATVMNRLLERGVGTQVHYIPLHMQPFYRRRYGSLSLPGAERYYENCLSLPLFPAMENRDVDRVIDVLQDVLN